MLIAKGNDLIDGNREYKGVPITSLVIGETRLSRCLEFTTVDQDALIVDRVENSGAKDLKLNAVLLIEWLREDGAWIHFFGGQRV